jgi:hypothetical protein
VKPARHSLVLAAALAVFAVSSEARADGPSAAQDAQAEDLFQRAKALMAQSRYREACPMLAESYKLAGGGGTLQNLAVCHEEEGKVAFAYNRFVELRALSLKANRPRSRQARRRASREAERSPLSARNPLRRRQSPGHHRLHRRRRLRRDEPLGRGPREHGDADHPRRSAGEKDPRAQEEDRRRREDRAARRPQARRSARRQGARGPVPHARPVARGARSGRGASARCARPGSSSEASASRPASPAASSGCSRSRKTKPRRTFAPTRGIRRR